ncbi:hypothetical protein QTP88_025810 [Uroleucon formosanum]
MHYNFSYHGPWNSKTTILTKLLEYGHEGKQLGRMKLPRKCNLTYNVITYKDVGKHNKLSLELLIMFVIFREYQISCSDKMECKIVPYHHISISLTPICNTTCQFTIGHNELLVGDFMNRPHNGTLILLRP